MAEKRLIDANALYDKVEKKYKVSSGIVHSGYREVLDMICDAHTVDAVEVVRCKDCKWLDPIKQECCGNIVTGNEGGADFTINFEENDFCSFGERRTDEKV